MVCRTGTLRFQRKSSNEVMNYSIRQCRIPPASNVTAQVVKPTRYRAVLNSGAGTSSAESDITHRGVHLHLERGSSLLGGPSAPALPGSESAPSAHQGFILPKFVGHPAQIPCTLLQFTIMNTFPRLPLQGQREC